MIQTVIEDGVATVTLDRAEKLNAMTRPMEAALREAVEKAGADPAMRLIVVTGAGRAFCAGADLSGGSAAPRPSASGLSDAAEVADANFAQRWSWLLQVPKPVVAAVNGPAVGVGLVLALYCDLRLASEAAKLGAVYVRRGLVAEYGLGWLLPRLVGPAQALDMLLTGRLVAADEALRLGLVNRVFPAAEFARSVRGFARDLAENCSPSATAMVKRQVWEGAFQDLAAASALADAEMERCRGTEDHREGVASFLEKRPPRFTGR